MVKIGDRAPSFNLKDEDGREVRLSDYKGKKVLLAFYPFAFSPTCTTECSDFQAELDKFKDVHILGISVDSHWTQKEFKSKLGLSFTLLSDFDKNVSKAYSVLREEGFSERAYIVLDEDGVIIYKKIMDSPGDKLDNDELLSEVAK